MMCVRCDTCLIGNNSGAFYGSNTSKDHAEKDRIYQQFKFTHDFLSIDGRIGLDPCLKVYLFDRAGAYFVKTRKN